MITASFRARLLGALLLLVALVALLVVFPDAFVPVVAVALLVAPFVNWRAWYRLRGKLRDSELRRKPSDLPIVSLRTATSAAFFLAIASTVTASLGLFVAARALGLVDAVDRNVFLVVLAYPPLLATGPAFDWLTTVGRLERVAASDDAA